MSVLLGYAETGQQRILFVLLLSEHIRRYSFKDAGFSQTLFSRFDRLSYLGSVKCRESKQEGGSDSVNKQEYIIEPYEDTVKADIKQIFNGPKEEPEIYIKPTEYLRTHSFGVIGGITYFVSSGTG